ncbi:MAG: ABC transporter permease [Burkholderiales bacterium]|nr:ABC transporter permease [Burkholderiales bacterium]
MAHKRLIGMIRKESLQILRDPSSIAIAFVLPIIMLFLFGHGVSLDAKEVRIGFVTENQNSETTDVRAAFGQSIYFDLLNFHSIQEAEQALIAQQIDGIVWLRSDFSRHLLSEQNATIGIIINGLDANQARITEGYIQGAWQTWLKHYGERRGLPLAIPITVEQRIWFNPAVQSRFFLVPGLIAVIMTLIGTLLTALVVAREWERGTMETLLVTPIRIHELLLGKLIPYFILGMGGMLLTVAMAVGVFEVPLRGSFFILLVVSALFMLVALATGLLISILVKNQFVAGQIAIIVTYLPAFILSGFIFDINSMPTAIQWITHIVPARYFVAILQTVFLAGNVWQVILPNAATLVLMAVVLLWIVRFKVSKYLE